MPGRKCLEENAWKSEAPSQELSKHCLRSGTPYLPETGILICSFVFFCLNNLYPHTLYKLSAPQNLDLPLRHVGSNSIPATYCCVISGSSVYNVGNFFIISLFGKWTCYISVSESLQGLDYMLKISDFYWAWHIRETLSVSSSLFNINENDPIWRRSVCSLGLQG